MNKNLDITPADRARLRRQLQRVAQSDLGIAELIKKIGYPVPRKREAGFSTLLEIITSQQVSTHAAAAINQRLRKLCGGNITWRKVLNRGELPLRECGLSRQKIEYAIGLAEMIKRGELDLDSMQQMDAEQAIAELVKIRGFGRWSGEIYAMFALGKPDVFPSDDLALQIAVQRHLGIEEKPSGKETALLAQRWSPGRSGVALLMWKFYGSGTLD